MIPKIALYDFFHYATRVPNGDQDGNPVSKEEYIKLL